MQKLVLIDGNAIIHRAYHALPPLTSKDGVVTNAVYGFFTMILKIINDLKPEYLVVCFDRPKPTFRQQMYIGYQAHRPKMDDNLPPQIKLVHEALEKAKIEIFEIDGYEADDLIGTISVECLVQKKDLQVIIVSGDRDLLQLVNNKVLVLAPIIGMTKMTLFDSIKIKEKYGLEPKQIIDYKALVGDPSDNYPGVTGIGPKTASGLINKFGSFENIYKNIKDVPEKIAEKLAKDAEQAAMAKKLATILTDAPVSFKIEKASIEHFNAKGLLSVFEELGFRSLMGRVKEQKVEKTEEKEVKKEEKRDNGQLGLL